jgi:hypothetical protein
MIRLACSLALLTLLSGCGLFEVYGKREHVVERFKLVDEKSGKPISDADVTIMATHGPQILPTINFGRPRDVSGRTDHHGEVLLRTPQGPKIQRLAYGIKDNVIVLHQWEMNWSRPSGDTTILFGDAESTWQYKKK